MFDVCRGARVMMFCISRRTHNTFPPYIRYVDVYIYIYMHHDFYEEFKIIYKIPVGLPIGVYRLTLNRDKHPTPQKKTKRNSNRLN